MRGAPGRPLEGADRLHGDRAAGRGGGSRSFVPLWGDNSFGDPRAPRRALEASVYGGHVRDRVADDRGRADDVRRASSASSATSTATSATARSRARRSYPLNAFLFRDKFGYCQQFSGAMALMLRMAGIPARVAAGFAPGSLNRDTGEYRVRDLDAHSWVEVYFNGIGWVTFDPTPAASPAEAQAADLQPDQRRPAARSTARARAWPRRTRRRAPAAPRPTDRAAASPDGCCCCRCLLLGAAGALVWRLVRRARRLDAAELAEAQLAELRRALRLARLGACRPTQRCSTLERRLGRAAGPAAARYAAALRALPLRPALARRAEPARAPRAAARPDRPHRPARSPGRAGGDPAGRPTAGVRPDLCGSKERGLQQDV